MTSMSREAMIKGLSFINVAPLSDLEGWSTRNLARAVSLWKEELERASSEFGITLA